MNIPTLTHIQIVFQLLGLPASLLQNCFTNFIVDKNYCHLKTKIVTLSALDSADVCLQTAESLQIFLAAALGGFNTKEEREAFKVDFDDIMECAINWYATTIIHFNKKKENKLALTRTYLKNCSDQSSQGDFRLTVKFFMYIC